MASLIRVCQYNGCTQEPEHNKDEDYHSLRASYCAKHIAMILESSVRQ
jgi:hypothetical protein